MRDRHVDDRGWLVGHSKYHGARLVPTGSTARRRSAGGSLSGALKRGCHRTQRSARELEYFWVKYFSPPSQQASFPPPPRLHGTFPPPCSLFYCAIPSLNSILHFTLHVLHCSFPPLISPPALPETSPDPQRTCNGRLISLFGVL